MQKLNVDINVPFKKWLSQCVSNIKDAKNLAKSNPHKYPNIEEETLKSIWRSMSAWKILAQTSSEPCANAVVRSAMKSISGMIKIKFNGKINPEIHPEWKL